MKNTTFSTVSFLGVLLPSIFDFVTMGLSPYGFVYILFSIGAFAIIVLSGYYLISDQGYRYDVGWFLEVIIILSGIENWQYTLHP